MHYQNQTFQANDKNPGLLNYFFVFSIISIYLAGCIYLYNFHVDDTYISLRYAKNLINEGSLTFNPGETPVEGYSNFLLVLIEALFIKLGVQNVVNIPKIVGILSGIVTIIITYRLSERIMKHELKFLPLLPSLALSISAPFVTWSVGGLETVLFTALILAGVYFLIVSMEDEGFKYCFLSDFLFVLAILCRPEGALFLVMGYLYCFIHFKNLRLRPRIKSLLSTMILITLYFSWKYYYFGDLLPMTYYAKHQVMSADLISGGLRKFGNFLTLNLNFLYLFLFAFTVWFIRKSSRPIVFLTFITIVYLLYVISLGYTVFMDQVFRFYVPIIPVFYITGVYGLSKLFENMPSIQTKIKYGILALICLAQLGFGAYNLNYIWHTDFGWGNIGGMSAYVINLNENWERIGQFIAQRVPPGSSIAVGDIGAIGYYSDLRVIDTWSLINKEIVLLRREQSKYQSNSTEFEVYQQKIRDYVLEQNPEVILLESHLDLRPDPRFMSNYVAVATPFKDFEQIIPLYVRRDIVHSSQNS